MKYHIETESKNRIRIRITARKLTEEQSKILRYAFSRAPGVTGVTIFKATARAARLPRLSDGDAQGDVKILKIDREAGVSVSLFSGFFEAIEAI